MLVAAIVLALAALGGWLWLAASQFAASVTMLEGRLAESQHAPAGGVDIATLPPILQEFARRNGGRAGGPTLVRAQQQAEMRLSPDQPFFPVTASQLFGTHQPGFVWNANATLMGIIPMVVIDSYVDGVGQLDARIAGAISTASAGGTEGALGEAMRFLAELPFNPDAILNAPDLHWQQADESSVTVSLQTAGGLATVRLTFDAAGDIAQVDAPERPRMVGDISVPTPWHGRFSDYGAVGAYRLPRHAEIAWLLPDGEFVYWRGAMTSLEAATP